MVISMFVLFLLSLTFIIIYKKDSRSIILGMLLILLAFQVIIVFYTFNLNYLAILIGVILCIFFLSLLILLFIAFLIQNMRTYQVKWYWLIFLSILGLSIMKEINITSIIQRPLINWLIGYFIGGTIGITLVLNAYLITSWLNLYVKKKESTDYIIVLGAGLNNEKVTPLLAKRIDKAIDLFKKSPNSKLIMSGGQGDDEVIAEGLAMTNYAIDKGISKDRIIIEDQSVNTKENILFSRQLIPSKRASFAIVSTHYHLLRAEIISKKLGFDSVGYGAKSGKSWIFTWNAFIREFFAYLYMQLKWVILFSIIYTLIYSLLRETISINTFLNFIC